MNHHAFLQLDALAASKLTSDWNRAAQHLLHINMNTNEHGYANVFILRYAPYPLWSHVRLYSTTGENSPSSLGDISDHLSQS